MMNIRNLALGLVLAGFCGCAFMKGIQDAQLACMSDDSCLTQTKKESELYKSIAGTVYPIAGPIAGGLVMYIGLWVHGRKKKVQPK